MRERGKSKNEESSKGEVNRLQDSSLSSDIKHIFYTFNDKSNYFSNQRQSIAKHRLLNVFRFVSASCMKYISIYICLRHSCSSKFLDIL